LFRSKIKKIIVHLLSGHKTMGMRMVKVGTGMGVGGETTDVLVHVSTRLVLYF